MSGRLNDDDLDRMLGAVVDLHPDEEEDDDGPVHSSASYDRSAYYQRRIPSASSSSASPLSNKRSHILPPSSVIMNEASKDCPLSQLVRTHHKPSPMATSFSGQELLELHGCSVQVLLHGQWRNALVVSECIDLDNGYAYDVRLSSKPEERLTVRLPFSQVTHPTTAVLRPIPEHVFERRGEMYEPALERHREYDPRVKPDAVALVMLMEVSGVKDERLLALALSRCRGHVGLAREYLAQQDMYPNELADVEAPAFQRRYQSVMEGLGDERVAINFNIDVDRRTMRTLDGMNWINSDIVQQYLMIKAAQHMARTGELVKVFSTFFLPEMRTSQLAKVGSWYMSEPEIFDSRTCTRWIIPFSERQHWVFVDVDFAAHKIVYYDSYHRKDVRWMFDAIKSFYTHAVNTRRLAAEGISRIDDFLCFMSTTMPQQRTATECGVFAMKGAECVIQGRPLTFSEADTPVFRQQIAVELASLNKRFRV